jgi:hypothetical protein
MATEKWISGAGQGLTWGDAFSTATLNSIVNGNAILSDISITNGTALDVFADVSVAMGSITIAAPNYIGIYLYPLNKDGSTYGDGRFGSSAAGPPASNCWVGNIIMPTGAAASEGTARGIILPPGTFKFVLYNQLGNTLAGSSGNTCQYRTYNRSIA